MREEWKGFTTGEWAKEVNVRDFIQKNYTPYDGDESFLAGPTDATNKLWCVVLLDEITSVDIIAPFTLFKSFPLFEICHLF